MSVGRPTAGQSGAELHHAAPRRSVVAVLARRWPTWTALVLAIATWGAAPIPALAEALLLFPLGYLAVAAIGSRRISWPAAVIGVTALAGLRLQHWVDPAAVLISAALVLIGWAVVRQRFLPPADGALQTIGWCAFVAFAAVAVAVDPAIGTPVIAAGWAAHAAWDLYHWLRNRGVSRSFAEWCGVFDLLGAVAILTTSAA